MNMDHLPHLLPMLARNNAIHSQVESKIGSDFELFQHALSPNNIHAYHITL